MPASGFSSSCWWSNGSTELNCLISTFVFRQVADQPTTFAPEHSVLSVCSGIVYFSNWCSSAAMKLYRKTSDILDSLTTPLMFCYVWDSWEDFRLVFIWSCRLNFHYHLEWQWTCCSRIHIQISFHTKGCLRVVPWSEPKPSELSRWQGKHLWKYASEQNCIPRVTWLCL